MTTTHFELQEKHGKQAWTHLKDSENIDYLKHSKMAWMSFYRSIGQSVKFRIVRVVTTKTVVR